MSQDRMEWGAEADMSPNSMFHWWPRVQGLSQPMPETVLVPTPGIMDWACEVADGLYSAGPPPGLEEITHAAETMGSPVFLRSDLMSGKHAWGDTCYVSAEADIGQHMWAICEQHMCAFGLPDPQGFAVRRYLYPAEGFRAFGHLGSGPMPIGVERRYFVRGPHVICHHPYWPPNSIDRPDREDWEQLLAEQSVESEAEVELLSGRARSIGARLRGHWSVDFMMDARGTWWFIDCARGQDSWHPECEHAGQE